MTTDDLAPIGTMIRAWRTARHLTQLDLSSRAAVSQRHLSWLETGRSRPSREMILHLADAMSVPVRERNRMLVVAGFAPPPVSRADADVLTTVHETLARLVETHAPFPALLLDRAWNIVGSNAVAAGLLEAVTPSEEPANLLRIVFHPGGFRRMIDNWDVVGPALWQRVLAEHHSDPFHAERAAVIDDVERWAGDLRPGRPEVGPVLTMDLRLGDDLLRMFSTTVQISGPLHPTVEELSAELFFPADGPTERKIVAMSGG